MISLTEKVVLASIDENKSKISLHAYNFCKYGIKGTVLLKLIELKKIKFEKKKIFIMDDTSTGDEVLDMALKYISASRHPISTNSWFYSYYSINRQLKEKVLEKLEDRGILMQEKRRFLGLIPYKRYNITNLTEKQEIKELISGILLVDSKKTAFENVIFTSLAVACGCIKLFVDKNELTTIKDKVKQIKKAEYFTVEDDSLSAVLRAIKYAIAAQAATSSAGA